MKRRVSGEDLGFTLRPFPFAPCAYNVLEGENVVDQSNTDAGW